MKEYESIDQTGDAAFDERCRSLLANRVAEAPAPPPGLFATNRRSVGHWTLGAAAAGLLLVAGAWFTSSTEDADHPMPETPSVEPAHTPTLLLDPTLESSDESTGEISLATEATDVMVPSESAVPTGSLTDTRAMLDPSATGALPVATEAESILDESSVEVPFEGELDNTPDYQSSQIPSSDVNSNVSETEIYHGQPAQELNEQEPPENQVEESAPTLRLPLTLPSGGGKH